MKFIEVPGLGLEMVPMTREQMIDEAVRRVLCRDGWEPRHLNGDWFDNCFAPFAWDVMAEFRKLNEDHPS